MPYKQWLTRSFHSWRLFRYWLGLSKGLELAMFLQRWCHHLQGMSGACSWLALFVHCHSCRRCLAQVVLLHKWSDRWLGLKLVREHPSTVSATCFVRNQYTKCLWLYPSRIRSCRSRGRNSRSGGSVRPVLQVLNRRAEGLCGMACKFWTLQIIK